MSSKENFFAAAATDAAISGTVFARNGLNNLLQVAREKKIDVVIIDDLSRLARKNLEMLQSIEEMKYLGIELHSVADNLNTATEESKLAYQMRGILNEIFIDDLRKKTIRGQQGQKERGYFVGEHTYGYKSEPHGIVKIDKKGRPRPEGYKMYIFEEEAAVVRRIFKMYAEGVPARIAKILNQEEIPSGKKMLHGWTPSTMHRILRNEKYIGKWAWGKCQNKHRPGTGIIHQVTREKPLFEATYEELRIIPQELWDEVQIRLEEVMRNWKNDSGKNGFNKKQGSYVKTFPKELLSGAMICSECGGTIGKVSGKGSGYYGCPKAARGACSNKLMVAKRIAETLILAEISKIISNHTALVFVLKKVEEYVAKMSDTVPEEIRIKKAELTQNEKRIYNFIKFIADGRSSNALADALALTEQKVETLKSELTILETTQNNIFKAPPIEWVADQVADVKEVLEKKTEQSALLLRKLLGQITLKPVTPDIGKPYLMAISNFQPLALFQEKRPRKGPLSSESKHWDNSSNSLHWWSRRGSNPRPMRCE